MREIKFRAWDTHERMIRDSNDVGGIHISGIGTLKHLEFMQSTGIKDKNGKEIYEGDIVKAAPENTSYKWKVVWVDNNCAFELERWDEEMITFPDVNHQIFEIIGNIYENPDLIK